MQFLDLRNVSGDRATWKQASRGFPHVYQLQSLCAFILARNGRPFGGLLRKDGSPDGVAGPKTRKRFLEVQAILQSQGEDIGARRPDAMCGDKSWESMIEYQR